MTSRRREQHLCSHHPVGVMFSACRTLVLWPASARWYYLLLGRRACVNGPLAEECQLTDGTSRRGGQSGKELT